MEYSQKILIPDSKSQRAEKQKHIYFNLVKNEHEAAHLVFYVMSSLT